MRYLIKIVFTFILTAFLTGCFEEPGTDVLLKDQFISLSVPSVQIDESSGGGTLQIDLAQGASSSVNIELSVEATGMIQGIDFDLPEGTSYTIPAGGYSVTIPYTVNDNIVFNPQAQTITIGIESVSGGIEILPIQSTTITVIENDCEFFPQTWVGVYTVDEAFTSGTNAPNGFSDFFEESYQVEIAIDPSDPTGTTAILSNSEGFDQYFVPGTIMKFNTCDVNVFFPDGDPNLADFANLVIESSSYDPDANTIRVDGEAGTYGPYGFTLTKQ